VLSPTIDVRPAALVNGRMVEWSELRPLLNEAAGGEVLQEVVLDRMLAEELDARGLVILPDDLDREQHLFYTTLATDPNVSARIARELRDRRGLGPQRFRQLLRRNAGLRALVAGEVVVSDEAVERTHQIVHGPKRQARIMVLTDLAAAEAALRRLEAGELFGDLAVELSTDSSAPRGGLLEPISRADASYPQVVRQTLWALATGEVSPPVLLETGYAVIMHVREIEGDEITLEEPRPQLERLVRLEQERLLMDRLARRLLQQATVQVIDEALRSSWERR
jgi:parvulin-like peptidyl-prolyl isomerase